MKLFNFNSTKSGEHDPDRIQDLSDRTTGESIKLQDRGGQPASSFVASRDVPEELFVEHEKPHNKNGDKQERTSETNDLSKLYSFLGQNLEKKGYEDALMNPDTSCMDQQIQFIRNELKLMIAKVKLYYTGHLRQVDFHIQTRERRGMIETVDELRTHKENIAEEYKIVLAIEDETVKGTGLSENLVLSYTKGFLNGFAAITYGTVLGRRDI